MPFVCTLQKEVGLQKVIVTDLTYRQYIDTLAHCSICKYVFLKKLNSEMWLRISSNNKILGLLLRQTVRYLCMYWCFVHVQWRVSKKGGPWKFELL